MNAEANAMFGRRTAAAINRGDLIPWPLIVAALCAMAALYFSSGRFEGLPVFAALLIFSRLSTWRLPKSFIITYGSRALILAVVITLINQTDTQDATVWYLKQADTNLAGYALAADIVLRAWERRDTAGAREGLGVVVLMTALLYAAATDTYQRWPVQLITPLYAIALLLTFRGFGLMQQPAASLRATRSLLVLLRAVVIVCTLGFAFAGVYAVTRYEYQVTNWAMQFVTHHHDSQHEIGFAAAPQLSRVFDPQPSTARVLVIDGQISEPHVRVAAFDTYRDSQWFPSVSDRNFGPLADSEPTPTSGMHLLKFTRLGDTADLVPVPLQSAAIHCDDPLEADSSGTLRDTRSGSFAPYAVVEANSPTYQGVIEVRPDEKQLAKLLAIPPEVDPKVTELAKKVAGGGEPARQIFRIQEYLRSHHAYSLSFDPHGEPLSDFILNDRPAHCQYFASAVVMMARAIGVPARYVGGFYAHEPYGNGETVVRQRDAHAWAECWLAGVGWVSVDATPSGGRPDAQFTDPPAWRRWWEKLTDLPGEIRAWLSDNAQLLEELAAVAALLWLCLWSIRRLLRWRRKKVPMAAKFPCPDAQLVELARRYEQWLKTRGMSCPPESTWRNQLAEMKNAADRSETVVVQEAELCEAFVKTYDRARFGAESGESFQRANEILNRIEKST